MSDQAIANAATVLKGAVAHQSQLLGAPEDGAAGVGSLSRRCGICAAARRAETTRPRPPAA